MQNMTYCGRIYQNPMRPTEIYFNVGWLVKGSQVFPIYEPWLAAHGISQAEYDQVIGALKKEFDENAPLSSTAPFVAASCLCSLTFGICFCPCLYLKMKVDAFIASLKELVTRVSNNKMGAVLIELGGPQYGAWQDSRGAPLMLKRGKGGSFPGGPPLGFNLIMSTQSPIPWPPAAVVPVAMPVAMPTAVVVGAPAQQAMVVRAEGEGMKFCTSCGQQLKPNDRFCGSCGAAQA